MAVVILRLAVAVVGVFLILPFANAADVSDALAKGTQAAVNACDVEKVQYFVDEEGVHPDDVIGYTRLKEPATLFRMAVERVGKQRPKWGARPGTKVPSGSSVYFKDDFGNYRQHKLQARMQPCMDVVKFVLERGASMDGPGLDKVSIMGFAKKSAWPDLLIMLKEYGADPYKPNFQGGTLFHGLARYYPRFFPEGRCPKDSSACTRQVLETEIFNWLIEHSKPSDVNHQDQRGNTPMIYAIRYATSSESTVLKRVQIWLKAGSDPCLRDKDGQTAADHALAKSWIEVKQAVKCHA